MTMSNFAAPAGAPTVDDILAAMRMGHMDDGRRKARGLLALDPGNWAAWHLASLISTTAGGRPPLAAFRRAVGIAPGRGELWATLGAALEQHGERVGALGAVRRGLALEPATADAMINLGVTMKEARQWQPAARWLDRAALLSPGNPVMLNNRALVHLDADDPNAAAAALRQAVAAAPFYVDARLNLAIVERLLDRPSAALAALVPSLVLTPSDSAFLGELGTILVTIGEADTGLAWLMRALAADPANQKAMASCLGALSYAAGVTEARRRTLYAGAAAQLRGHAPIRERPALPTPPADGRITIGYVSPSWHAHPMTHQLRLLLDHHRRERVRTIAYADLKRRDATTEHLRRGVELWRETAALSDRALAETIRADGVDVLVLLAPHEDGSRRALPVHRAAPLQVSLHDIATSGLEEVDAWITDPVLHPADSSEWFSERLIEIPSLFLQPPIEERPIPAKDAVDGAVRFASFNNPAKLSAPALAAWAEILRRVPAATLLLKYRMLYQDPAVAMRIRRFFGVAGVDPARVILGHGALPLAEHLDMIAGIDVVLDPFPYNGNTATMEALWMEVPVVALAGARFIGRMGADILAKIGREDLIARTPDEYVAIAVALASDARRRAALRRDLRAAIKRSPLADAAGFARSLEEALIALVEAHRRGGG